jgi:transcriptional regulator with XRE-family HTH domain
MKAMPNSPAPVASVLRRARDEAGLTLRALAARAGTSHSALAAYEAGRKVPNADTVDRVLTAAGFAVDRALSRRVRGTSSLPRGEELVQVLELAAQFPARHDAELRYPIFGLQP